MPPASSKIASDARSGAIEKIGGLLICQRVSRRHRNELRLELHAEACRRIVPPPTGQARQLAVGRVPLVHERSRDRAGSGVEILVGTPDREIDIPIVQRQRHVADCVREIDPDHAAVLLRRRRDFLDVEQLTGEKIHAGDKHERDLVALLLQRGLDVILVEP